MRIHTRTNHIALSLLLAGTATPGLAAAPDTSQWECNLCVSPVGWALDLELGPIYVDEDAYRFGDFTGMEEQGSYLFADVLAQYWAEDATYWRFDGRRLGLDSRALDIEGGRQGSYRLGLFYRQFPRFRFDTTRTPYDGVGTQRLTLPTGWVRAGNTANMSALQGSLQSAPIESKRQDMGANLRLTPTQHWRFDADYKRTEKEGTDIFAGSFFFNAVQLIKPVDYTTDEVELQARYLGEDWHLGLGYYGSFFSNANSQLRWDNPYSSSASADSGRAALSPDNSAQRISVSGALRLPASTTLSGQLSVGRMEQDEALLPYTTNTSLVTSSLPLTSANTEVDTTNADLRLRSTAFEDWVVSGRISYDERDDQSPQNDFDYVITDRSLSPDSARNTRYSYERSEYELDGDYDLGARQRLGLGYRYRQYRRDNQEVGKTESNRISAKYVSRALDDRDMRLKLYIDRRDNSNYQTLSDPAPQNPLMRKYNMADRRRTAVEFQHNWMPGTRTSLGVHLEMSRDEYTDSPIGLRDSERQNVGVDASWAFAREASVYAAVSYERLESRQTNSSTFSQPDWEAQSEDRFVVASMGLKLPRLGNRWGMDISYDYAHSNGDVAILTGGLQSDFPSLETRFQRLNLAFDYRYNKRLNFRLGYGYERYDADNWALDNVEPDTVRNLLALGAATQDYEVNLIYLTVRYRFGPSTTAFTR